MKRPPAWTAARCSACSSWSRAGRQPAKAIIFVSHRMEEIFQIADRYSVLRNGETVGEGRSKRSPTRDAGGADGRKGHRRERAAQPPVSRRRPPAGQARSQLEVEDLRTERAQGRELAAARRRAAGHRRVERPGPARPAAGACLAICPIPGRSPSTGEPVHFTHPRQAMEQGRRPGARRARRARACSFIRSILENLQLPSWRNYGFPLRMRRASDAMRRHGRSDLNLKMAGLERAGQQPVGRQRAEGGHRQVAAARSAACCCWMTRPRAWTSAPRPSSTSCWSQLCAAGHGGPVLQQRRRRADRPVRPRAGACTTA